MDLDDADAGAEEKEGGGINDSGQNIDSEDKEKRRR